MSKTKHLTQKQITSDLNSLRKMATLYKDEAARLKDLNSPVSSTFYDAYEQLNLAIRAIELCDDDHLNRGI